ncbi:alpha/beta fold hydrolase [Dietzia sp.]|uniref:alpha/beta fold hydrolase n=1 Tax=Dietzia sp. TaxID=1871616 RepID=UPI002FDA52F4
MRLASLSYEMNEAAGSRGAGAATVLLLGSLGSNRSMWTEQIRALGDSYRVLAVDLRGHGGSEILEGDSSVVELAADIVSLLDSLEIERVHMVGLSLGGAVALEMGIRHEEKLDSLTVICTSASFGEPGPWRELAALVRAEGMQAVAQAVAARWISPALADADPELVRRLEEIVVSTPVEGYASACEALAEYDVRTELGRIRVPVLAIAGAEDPATPPAELEEIIAGIGHGRLEVLDPAAHVPTFEQPERISELIRGHVADNAESAGAGR